ncbi:hypothetical protein [Bacteroides helcogenes]|uniref:Bro-N domain-containing protein n=1 Tax=Bacteroides helcogenes (strain ATCC 35417 / DSM 20613 / JCM 6297 / CCUG 15421 / P 36-108) TaxID=693979 RepID=E6SQG9_BACT6|nr:hypothetical protein [Bacteroides helcogenes]ADV45016.1 hypothetical protein Bache_3088 [Bacteroides helcogenes P 36-108]MDY5239875.1 hypothetical protein [Bacteroides helcogenes]
MTKKETLELFEERKVRTVWDDEKEKWYFSIVDVVGILVESKDYQAARKYWNKLKQRLKEDGFEPVTNCHQLKLRAEDGKMRLTDEIRKDLTDQWKLHNVDGVQYATLTDIIYQQWAGKSAKEYKQFKGLKKENLRDNMTNEELVLNMLAELSTTSITKAKDPQTLGENMQCAVDGGDVARVAREQLELKTGREVVTPLSAKKSFEAQKPEGEIEGGEKREE